MSMNRASGNSVNVDRKALLEALKKNKSIHIAQYQEALTDYRNKLIRDLESALAELTIEGTAALTAKELCALKVQFNPPVSYEDQYNEIIDMLEMSVDQTINLDAASFKAYVKNEWYWSSGFTMSAMSYKA